MTRLLVLFVTLAATLLSAETAPAEVTVVSVYEGMASYAEAVAANPAADRETLWREKVVDPYWKRCAEGAKYLDYGPSLTTAVADVGALRSAAEALRASAVETAVRTAAEKAALALPGPPTTICILAADPAWTYLRDMNGVGGFTPGPGKIWLTILPEGDWKDWVTYAVAHEYHHSAWMAGPREINDLADYLIFEGRADSFARLIDPLREAPWTRALTARQERAAWRILQRELGSTDAQKMQQLMFGGAGGVPRWAGYAIGFRIVQAYLNSYPDLTISQWTSTPASQLIMQASYVPEK